MTADQPYVEEVAEGVFAYIQPDGSWGINNAGFIVDGATSFVVDTCVTEHRTRALRDEVRRHARSVTALLNTHHHRDHTFGNFLFKPAAIVGHSLCREEVLRLGLAPMEIMPADDFGHIEIAAPNVVFDDTLVLHLDDGRRIEAIHVGPAHTTNDVVYWLPDHKVAFAGDVVLEHGVPYIADGTLEGSLRALDVVEALQPDVIVPGHGAVCDPSVIKDLRAYFHAVKDVATQVTDSDDDVQELARHPVLHDFRDWTCSERTVANLRVAKAELVGAPRVEPVVLIADMTKFTGAGQMRSRA